METLPPGLWTTGGSPAARTAAVSEAHAAVWVKPPPCVLQVRRVDSAQPGERWAFLSSGAKKLHLEKEELGSDGKRTAP